MPFSIGIRNSHDKSLRLGLTAGMRVFVCSNIAFSGEFTPVLAKHTRSFNLIDTLAVGVDRIQRSFEPMRRQVEEWRQAQITDERAKLILYTAFVDGKLEAPRTLLPEVHRLHFQPEYEEFSPRTMWSLSNAFTSAFKELDPVPPCRWPRPVSGRFSLHYLDALVYPDIPPTLLTVAGVAVCLFNFGIYAVRFRRRH